MGARKDNAMHGRNRQKNITDGCLLADRDELGLGGALLQMREWSRGLVRSMPPYK
jgi:hypothetical protein